MIRVNLINENNDINGIEVKGHADYDKIGKDLVCAAVSAIITGGFNSFNDNQIREISLKEGYAKIIVNPGDGLIILNTIIVQLKTIAEAYPKNIIIKWWKRCKNEI